MSGVAPGAEIDLPVARESAGVEDGGGIGSCSGFQIFALHVLVSGAVTFFTGDAQHEASLAESIDGWRLRFEIRSMALQAAGRWDVESARRDFLRERQYEASKASFQVKLCSLNDERILALPRRNHSHDC